MPNTPNTAIASAAMRTTITATSRSDGDETLFQLPRTDNFLRAFAKMAFSADQALHDLLDEMNRLARRRTSEGSPSSI